MKKKEETPKWEQYNPGAQYLPNEEKLGESINEFGNIIGKIYLRKPVTEALLEEVCYVLSEILDKQYPDDFYLHIIVGCTENQQLVLIPGNDHTRDNYFRKPTLEEQKTNENGIN